MIRRPHHWMIRRPHHWMAPLTLLMLATGIPSGAAPSKHPEVEGVVVLFDGKQSDLDKNWLQGAKNHPGWTVKGGAITARDSDIYTRRSFSNFQLHLEFKVPYRPTAHGQSKGNSGVILQDRFEIQVLDSYNLPSPGTGDSGAIYTEAAPLLNASKPPEMWQTYDIIFRAPRFEPFFHKLMEPARVTLLLNGVVVQNNQPIYKPTGSRSKLRVSDWGPIHLQYHGNPVQFRNIWILPLPPEGANHY